MSRDPSPTSDPIELEAPHGASALTIAWSDGVRSRYRHALLRGFCPCAHCQGHQGPVRWADGARDEDLPLVLVEEVGNYAVRLGWQDGHATGIYSFEYLRRLAPLARRAEEAGLDAVRGETVAR
jgi:DUF971 family protein